MNILLSAYACEPNKGSEPGVGWNWAIELSKYNKVWVITRDNNEKTIKDYLSKNKEYNSKNLHFIYVGLPKYLTFWKKGRRGMRLFYMMWQYKAYKIAKNLNKGIKFDLIHHVTFVSYTQPTYMYKLGIPMIWGPVAGGDNIPKNVKIKLSMKQKLYEFLRILSQNIMLYTRSIRKTMQHSKYILVATNETKMKLPLSYHKKVIVMPAIGMERVGNLEKAKENDIQNKVKIIMAGQLIYLKAVDIGIKAFLALIDKCPNLELHILGEGSEKKKLQQLSGQYLDKRIFFREAVQHDEIFEFYKQFDIYLTTTLRDSGCMTMLEAMSVGLPCLCIATGGPKVLSDGIPELQIQPDGYEECINNIADKLEEMYIDKQLRDDMGNRCLEEALKFSYDNKYKVCKDMYMK